LLITFENVKTLSMSRICNAYELFIIDKTTELVEKYELNNVNIT